MHNKLIRGTILAAMLAGSVAAPAMADQGPGPVKTTAEAARLAKHEAHRHHRARRHHPRAAAPASATAPG